MNVEGKEHECAVCLQKCHHPTQLPCGHIFCFLCVKGIAIQSKRCAMCRAEIPTNYLDHPVLLEKLSPIETDLENTTANYQWYYEGSNGWWKYDERSNNELEAAFNASEDNLTLLLAGTLYIIDFQNMLQMRRNDPSRRRKIRRDTPMLPAKGVAGIKDLNAQSEETNHPTEESSAEDPTNERNADSDVEDNIILINNVDHDAASQSSGSNVSLDFMDVFNLISLDDFE